MPECPSDRHSSIRHWFCDSKFPPYACIRRFRTTKKPYAHISSPLRPRAPLILYRRWQPLILGYFEEQALEPNIVCIADDARTALLWASEGLGIALAPESALCLNSDPALIRRIITQPQIHSSICLVKRKERSLSLVGNAFFQSFHATAIS